MKSSSLFQIFTILPTNSIESIPVKLLYYLYYLFFVIVMAKWVFLHFFVFYLPKIVLNSNLQPPAVSNSFTQLFFSCHLLSLLFNISLTCLFLTLRIKFPYNFLFLFIFFFIKFTLSTLSF